MAVGRGGSDPADVQRHFRYVGDAMALAGVVPTALVQALKHELADALVVRRLVPAASFIGAEPGDRNEADEHRGPVDGAVVWLEAEIERHLDLLANFDPAIRPDVGAETLRIIAGPARAFEVAGVLGSTGKALLNDLTASVAAAGYDPGRAAPGDGRVRRDWVRFLRDRPPPLPDTFEPAKAVHVRTVLGAFADERTVRVEEVAWSEHAVSLTVAFRGPDPFAPYERAPLHARLLDPRGHLHLGQPTRSFQDGGTSATFLLRPGLEDGVSTLQVRITTRGRKVEGPVAL